MAAVDPGSGGGGRLEHNPALLHAGSRQLHVVSTQLLSMAVPKVTPPAGVDETSLARAAELNARAAKLTLAIDAASLVLAGGATEIANTAASFMAQEGNNLAAFASVNPENAGLAAAAAGAGAAEEAAAQMPAFPAPPAIPDMSIPSLPALPSAKDAEWHSRLINGGSGPAPLEEAAHHWNNTGRQLAEAVDVVDVARQGIQAGWQSDHSDSSHRALTRFSSYLNDLSKSATALGNDYQTHAASFRKVRDRVPTPDQASGAKDEWVQAVDENMRNGGLSTGRVFAASNEITKQNEDTSTAVAGYSSEIPSSGSDPGTPPQISANNPTRSPGVTRPAPGDLSRRLAGDKLLGGLDDKLGKDMKDPKAMAQAMMAAMGGAMGSLGAIGGAGKSITQPFQSGLQQLGQIAQGMGKGGAANPAGIRQPTKPSTGGGAPKKAGGGGGGGVKSAGIGGIRNPAPPAVVPAAVSAPKAVVGGEAAAAAAAGSVGRAGAMGGGMMPAGAGAGRRGEEKAKARNKQLFPDSPEFDDDQEHAPAVLGEQPKPEAPPAYDGKLQRAELIRKDP
ncbi:PPE domain-containing protein [Mycobacteroides abscessus subsp. abscessus]|uniref:PPE domain-containing protein n=1 Tax=Mycobacteroides abscessus TaxID=36809 RepID=UPI0009415D21|nr:PPE domain-containing protein [Mycobacteroides abscessus]MDO2986839.1 PPE domain-containing protein [Mycobacteroides abscessus subsp. abscessus]